MGILKYTLITFKRDFKHSLFYIGSMIISIAMIFNAFNIIFNENVIPKGGMDYQMMCLLGLIILAVSILFMLFANSYYIEDNYKEYGIISISGKSVYEISAIIILRTLISTSIAVILGCLLGSIISPMIIGAVYKVIGFDGSVNYISQSGLVMTCLIMIVQFMCVILINTGNIYRKKVNELMNKKNQPFMPDERSVKISPYVYIIIFISPIILLLLPISGKDKILLMSFCVLIASYGTQGLVRYVIPNWISNLKSKKLINDKIKIVCISNLIHSIQKSTYLILVLVLSTTFSIAIACRYEMGSILNIASFGCFTVSILIMSFTIVYKFLVDGIDRKKNVQQLLLLGYTRSEIKRVIAREVKIYYIIILSISLIHIIALGVAAVIAGILSVLAFIYLVLGYIILFVITSFISYSGYKKTVLR